MSRPFKNWAHRSLSVWNSPRCGEKSAWKFVRRDVFSCVLYIRYVVYYNTAIKQMTIAVDTRSFSPRLYRLITHTSRSPKVYHYSVPSVYTQGTNCTVSFHTSSRSPKVCHSVPCRPGVSTHLGGYSTPQPHQRTCQGRPPHISGVGRTPPFAHTPLTTRSTRAGWGTGCVRDAA